jgi:hypothetical protein
MPSESRRPYVALTPHQADFALQSFNEPSTSTTTFPPDEPCPDEPCTRLQSALDSVQDFVFLNAGLLLVTAACVAFSFVNVCVKKLQNLDDPVSTLQVRGARLNSVFHIDLLLPS